MTSNQSFQYILSDELKEAITIAQITERPLLLKGEPGTGKSQLAEYLAIEQDKPLFTWNIKSTTTAKEGLYFYDALTRLNDSRFSENHEKIKNLENYIHLGTLGQAFISHEECVVLIDEIDKADIEFPNDLLLELDKMEFVIPETGKKIKAKKRPLTIITSNNEKELPQAFLRRCIFHFINFPSPDLMQKIIECHFPNISQKIMERTLQIFYSIRRMDDLKKHPSTSEFLDWIKIVISGSSSLDSKKIPYLGALIKNEEDFEKF